MIEIYADGACSGNPGPGGWGVLLRVEGIETELCGGEPATTNNRMELTAVIEALQSFTDKVDARVYTDSQYVQKGISEWIHSWKRRGWKTSGKDPVKNEDLWRRLDELLGYIGTWSAVKAAREALGADPVAELAAQLRSAWGDPRMPRRVTWPLAVRAGIVR